MDISLDHVNKTSISCPENLNYLSISKLVDSRKKTIKKSISMSDFCFSDGQSKSCDIIDAFHGEMHFGADSASMATLNDAWKHIMQEEQEHFIHHNKKQPDALIELALDFLFERLREPGITGLDGIPISADDTVVVPYSSTQLVISALKSRPKKNLSHVLCPEGFYKGAAKLAAAAGLIIKTFPVDLHNDGVIIPEILDHYLAIHRDNLALLWLTMPGNPLIAKQSLEQLEAIAKVIVKYDMDVLIDMAFDKILPKGEYLPLPNIRVQNKHGQWQTLHERTFSITGNSKGLGATGPWKLGAGVCGNKQWRQETLNLVTAVTFQRESTHLIYSGTRAVSQLYLENNQKTLKNLQQNVKQLIQKLNHNLGDDILISYGRPVYTPFHCLGINRHHLEKIGIRDSLQFADFLLAGAGIDSVELDLVGICKPGVRLNVASPRVNGKKSPGNIHLLFNRLEALLRDAQKGLNYMDVLNRIGITETIELYGSVETTEH